MRFFKNEENKFALKWGDIRTYVQENRIGIFIAAGGIILVFLNDFWEKDFTWLAFFEELFDIFATEFIAIAITVLLIDYLNHKRQTEELREQLIRDLRDPSGVFSGRAIRELEIKQWLNDGSLDFKSLESTSIQNINISKASLRSVDFYNAKINSTVFQGCDFNESSFQKVSFADTKFSGSNLVSCDFSDAEFYESSVYRCDVANSVFSEANASGINMGNSNFTNSVFIGGDLSGSIISNCKFNNADFSRCNLSNAKFSSVDLTGANLLTSNLDSVEFSDIVYDDKTKWPDGFTPS